MVRIFWKFREKHKVAGKDFFLKNQIFRFFWKLWEKNIKVAGKNFFSRKCDFFKNHQLKMIIWKRLTEIWLLRKYAPREISYKGPKIFFACGAKKSNFFSIFFQIGLRIGGVVIGRWGKADPKRLTDFLFFRAKSAYRLQLVFEKSDCIQPPWSLKNFILAPCNLKISHFSPPWS